ncbi:hypothetical protein ACJRO7_006339 [Eucalyptus globulus]|uniref:DYW domain-containing protein n=1 Tax=Eucalyptus globulus TaxID=34317 RepID=A0ABD3IHD2_EUCGL
MCWVCILIDSFAKGSADFVSAHKVFVKMPKRNVVAWTLMMTRCTQLDCLKKAVDMFLDMLVSGTVADRFTPKAVQLHSWVIRSGLASYVSVGCSLADMYVKCVAGASPHDSRKDILKLKGTRSIKLFSEMIKGPVRPNHFALATVLKACESTCDVDLGIQIYVLAIKLGFASDTCVGNSLVAMYSRLGPMEDVQRAFDALFEENLIFYNTLVDAYAKSLESDQAFELLHEIERGIGASAFTFASLLSGAAYIGASGKGKQIHARMVKSGLDSNQFISNALTLFFCGRREKIIISWASMITNFTKYGFVARTLDTFSKMLKAGVRPNEITYVAVLSSCSYVGLISDGSKHFRSMYTEHGISGSLVDALQFINSTLFRADTLVWCTYLGACRVHGNVELAKQAVAMIFGQEPANPASYVLLSKMCASAVHKFYVGDTSHPKAQEIYDELDRLASRIKKLGYFLNTEFVLYDVEEGQKEQYLLQHREKIAVLFGLIGTSSLKSVRVFKNLRIYRDCHSVLKISQWQPEDL